LIENVQECFASFFSEFSKNPNTFVPTISPFIEGLPILFMGVIPKGLKEHLVLAKNAAAFWLSTGYVNLQGKWDTIRIKG
jgi:hypothetical protein